MAVIQIAQQQQQNAYDCIETESRDRDVLRAAMNIHVFTTTAGTNVAKMCSLKTFDVGRTQRSGQVRVLSVSFLRKMKDCFIIRFSLLSLM